MPMSDDIMSVKTFRVPSDLWTQAQEKAAESDEKLSVVLRDLLEGYVSDDVHDHEEGCEPCAKAEAAAAASEFKDYSPEQREKMAKNGEALPDGSYPIADCEDLKNAIQAVGRAKDRDDAVAHIKKRAKALDCPDVELPDSFALETLTVIEAEEKEENEGYAAIFGIGRLSESEDPETAAAVLRVRELLAEGAVGVSIAHDMNPDAMPDFAVLEQLLAEENFEEIDKLMDAVTIRPRHVAIVDTPAFSDARLSLNEDGSVSGPVVFEGRWTGDMRMLPFESLVWDEELLPIPIIWDRAEGDHTGMTVGWIDSLERQSGVTSAMLPEPISEDQVEALVAAAGGGNTFPAAYFAKWKSTKPEPMHIDAPDSRGLRRIWGHIVPKGVCHRSDMGACFQYPEDVDPQLRGFHTGFAIPLDDGTSIRPGALTFEGAHIDTRLARRGVKASDLANHRDDANRVLGTVRAWPDAFGLAVSGVVPSDITNDDLIRAFACSPSVELWPSGRGRTLVGVHIVPTPAWPVAASAGEVQEMTGTEPIVVEDIEELQQAGETPVLVTQVFSDSEVGVRLGRIEKALALLVSDKLDHGIPEIPEVVE